MKKNILPATVLFCVILLICGITFGHTTLSLQDIFHDGTLTQIGEMRLMRMLTAFAVGGALALSGLIFQAILRNSLAEPFTLGLSGGAAVGAAIAYVTGAYLLSAFAVGICAFCGAIFVLALVLLLTHSARRNAENMLLTGVILGTIMSGILMYMISVANNSELAGITWWLLGDLQGNTSGTVVMGGAVLFVATCVAQRYTTAIDALSLGEAYAHDFGFHTRRLMLLLTITAAICAAQTVVMAGIIGFCGLIIPHAVRKVYGHIHRNLVLPTVFTGGAFLMLCDIISRCLTSVEIPVGVITAIIGGPAFLLLLNKQRMR